MTSPQEPDPGQAWGAPANQYPPYPGPAAYPPPGSVSGWAIAAFVLALLTCAPLGVIFGIVALVQTRDGRQHGRGLAITAIVISGLWAIGGAAIGGLAVWDVSTHEGGSAVDGMPPAGRDQSVQVVVKSPGTNWKYMNDHTAACLAHFRSDRVGSIKG